MGFNPNFNNQNPQLGNLSGNPLMGNFYGANPNLQHMAQNDPMGAIQMLAVQLQTSQQINLLNQQLQNPNFAAASLQQGGQQFLLQNLVQNLSPVMGFPNGQFLAHNQMVQGNHAVSLLGQNPMTSGLGYGSNVTNMGPNGMYNHSMQQRPNGCLPFKVNHNETNSSHNLNFKSPTMVCGFSKGGSSHNSFQKSRLHDVRRNNKRQFNKKGEKGHNNLRDQKLRPTNIKEANTVHRRPITVHYSDKEIQEWREARKKNFPTKSNIEEVSSSKLNEDAKLRRQQLKDVLAKQAELGVEVAEIPPSYLREPEVREKNEAPSTTKFNKRRGRGKGRDNWRAKRKKFNKGGPSSSSPAIKSEPSLLKKLLSADIKSDKSRLLHVFRFMVLNDFFKQWPDKPLEFPVIIAKDASDTNLVPVEFVDVKARFEEIGNEKEASGGEDMVDGFDEEEAGSMRNEDNRPTEMEDGAGEQDEKPEEGEITD